MFYKKVFLINSQNLQENTWPEACNIIKIRTPQMCFPVNFGKFSLRMTASEFCKKLQTGC